MSRPACRPFLSLNEHQAGADDVAVEAAFADKADNAVAACQNSTRDKVTAPSVPGRVAFDRCLVLVAFAPPPELSIFV